jgi:hypothetical protein
MAAYYRSTLADFIAEDPQTIIGRLHIKYTEDGFAQKYQLRPSVGRSYAFVARSVRNIGPTGPQRRDMEYFAEIPLYRLQLRADIVVLGSSTIVTSSPPA